MTAYSSPWKLKRTSHTYDVSSPLSTPVCEPPKRGRSCLWSLRNSPTGKSTSVPTDVRFTNCNQLLLTVLTVSLTFWLRIVPRKTACILAVCTVSVWMGTTQIIRFMIKHTFVLWPLPLCFGHGSVCIFHNKNVDFLKIKYVLLSTKLITRIHFKHNICSQDSDLCTKVKFLQLVIYLSPRSFN